MSYIRLSIEGEINTGAEVWSINPVFDPTGEFPGWDQSQGDAAVAAINALTIPSNLLLVLSNRATVVGCRLEARDDVTDELIGVSEARRTTAVSGSSTVNMPPQAAIVTSLRTATAGRSGRGRLYWPAMGGVLDTSFRLSTPTNLQIATDMKSYLTAIQGALGTSFPTIGFNLAVRSKTTHTTPHVNRLQVGNIVDTQRRRRDALPESYASVSY